MLEVRDLSVSYGTVRAVVDLSLRVGEGDAVALLGANGAGKTTTLSAISRLVPYQGTITFDGTDLRQLAPHQVSHLGIIHVPEGRRLFARLSVHENLQLAYEAQGKREHSYTFSDVYDLFPQLVGLRNRLAWSLSGGEQQMVAIGRALLASPNLLILDEPSLGLSPAVGAAVIGALRQMVGTVSMLVVEQNAAVALELCSRGYVMSQGRVTREDTAEGLSDRGILLAAYTGQEMPVQTEEQGS